MRSQNPESAARVSADFGLPIAISRALLSRNLAHPDEIALYLDPPRELIDIRGLLPNLEEAASRVLSALDARTPILVYGDYDVDGIAASTVLFGALKTLAAKSNVYLPSRFGEGYGLSVAALERAKNAGYGMVVTVDCGIGSIAEVEAARAMGLDIVITDHHTLGDTLPDTVIVNPLLRENATSGGESTAANPCGAAVALGLAGELFWKRGRDRGEAANRWLEIVALATIADSMALIGVNRAIVRHGIDQMWDTTNPGLRALLEATGVGTGAAPTAEQLAFGVIPALNACGRMLSPRLAFSLFEAKSADEARQIAHQIKGLNSERQLVQERVFEEAARMASEDRGAPAHVLFCEHWHAGVLGIVAAQIAETFGKPAVVLSCAHGEDGGIRGSARAPAGWDLRAALEASAAHLDKFGGHPSAAGISLSPDSLEAFREAFCGAIAAAQQIAGNGELQIDAEASAAEMAAVDLDSLLRLEPTGEGNPAPVFALRQCMIEAPRAIGRNGTTLVCNIEQGGTRFKAVGFRMSHIAARFKEGAPYDIAVALKPDFYGGVRSVRCQLLDAVPSSR
ncbi:MAG: single-stranded-DNA-specific exonuclease RecJ [bacterium]